MYCLLNAPYIRWLDSSDLREQKCRASAPQLTVQAVSSCWLLPSNSEQRAIVAFLDRETARIDVLVEKKERLIELLQEKRAALITRVVTKGLDPTVPRRDSGFEWLGEIPTYWEVKRLWHLTPSDRRIITASFSQDLMSMTELPSSREAMFLQNASASTSSTGRPLKSSLDTRGRGCEVATSSMLSGEASVKWQWCPKSLRAQI